MQPWQVVLSIIIYIASGLILSFVSDSIVKKKGYDEKTFFFVGLFFNVFGFIGACALPDKFATDVMTDELKKLNKQFDAFLKYVEGDDDYGYEEPYVNSNENYNRYEPTYKKEEAPQPKKTKSDAESLSSMFSSQIYNRPSPAPVKKPINSDNGRRGEIRIESVSHSHGSIRYNNGELTCSVCGANVKLNDTSCPHCGAKFEASPDSGGLGYVKNINL